MERKKKKKNDNIIKMDFKDFFLAFSLILGRASVVKEPDRDFAFVLPVSRIGRVCYGWPLSQKWNQKKESMSVYVSLSWKQKTLCVFIYLFDCKNMAW